MADKVQSPISITIPSYNADQRDELNTNRFDDGNFELQTQRNLLPESRSERDYRKNYTIKPNSREAIAVKMIENAWCSYRDRQMFRLLKHAVCAAEHSLSHEILRKISPQEANLLKDPCLKLKIKFRFGGTEFPPVILFKLYTQVSDGNFTKYISGKKSIKAATNAAREACNQMGNRIFYEQLIVDTLQTQKGKIIDENDVVTLKDYMKYTSFLDEMPARMGGKANSWRRLDLEDLSRHTIFYDIVYYAKTQKMTNDLLKELPTLLEKPNSQSVQLKHIEILSKIKSPEPIVNTSIIHLNNSNFKSDQNQASSRRSQKALHKVAKMRKAYTFARSETLTTEIDILPSTSNRTQSIKIDDALKDEFEDQVNDLYLWTQNLSINDDFLKSPRLPTV